MPKDSDKPKEKPSMVQSYIRGKIMGATGADKVVKGLKNAPAQKIPAAPRLKPKPEHATAGGERKDYKDLYRD